MAHTVGVFALSSKARLTSHDLGRFPEDTLFHRIARVVCGAGCLPRKELFEAWEMARRVRRRFRGGRIVDLCAGHGLVGQILLLLDATSPAAVLTDSVLPSSAATLHRALANEWPRLDGRVEFREEAIEGVELTHDDLVVSVHACGDLTDQAIACAMRAGARLAVMPCCHNLDVADAGQLTGWLFLAPAVPLLPKLNNRKLNASSVRWPQMT